MMSIKIQKNEIVYYVDTKYIIDSILDYDTVLAINTETGTSDVLKIVHLTSSPVTDYTKPTIQDLSTIPQKHIDKAKKRLEAILPVYQSYSRQVIDARAQELGISTQSMYNWINAYKATEQLSSLVFEGTLGGKGKSRLDPKIETIIEDSIREYYLTPQKPTVTKLHQYIAMRCKNANLDIPGIATVRRRVQQENEYNLLKKREGRKAALQKKAIKKEYPDGNYPLEVIMIDHTRVDVILVDDEHRIQLDRPWITLAIDVYSRMITGFYVSMETPGFFGTGQCLANSMLSKEAITTKYHTKSKWPVWGIPKMIHMDNAKEFRGTGIERVCDEYGISVVWRPVKRPNFGAHIERLVKTLNEDIHTLKATTFSNPRARGEYDSQKKANMTLSEFEAWLIVLIVDVYHNKIHSSLGMSPLKKYEEGIFGTATQPPRGILTKIEDENLLRINTLPSFERTIQPYGIQIDTITYYSEVLNTWIGQSLHKSKRKFLVRRDPRDISHIYFFDPQDKRYYEIPYRNTFRPSVSIWEYRAVQRHLKRENEREYSEDEIFEALERLREIEEQSEQKTKEMRRNKQRRARVKEVQKLIPDDFRQSDVESIEDDFDDLQPFDGIEG